MYRGKTLFKCTECGHLFVAPDIELGATSLSVPQRCPKCESIRTRPASPLGGLGQNKKYEGIWEKWNPKEFITRTTMDGLGYADATTYHPMENFFHCKKTGKNSWQIRPKDCIIQRTQDVRG